MITVLRKGDHENEPLHHVFSLKYLQDKFHYCPRPAHTVILLEDRTATEILFQSCSACTMIDRTMRLAMHILLRHRTSSPQRT